MNKKGFTLIELLVVIVIIGLISILIVPTALNLSETSKQKSYDILIKNIVTASQSYYEECEYGDLSDESKYDTYACEINNNTITTTLGVLANTGLLDVKDNDKNDETIKVVLDPRNKDEDISNCSIKIKKNVNSSTYKVTYQIQNNSTNDICPKTYE